MPFPTIKDVAYIMTLIGHMVMYRPVPKHTIECLEDKTKTVPKVYGMGYWALQYCKEQLGM